MPELLAIEAIDEGSDLELIKSIGSVALPAETRGVYNTIVNGDQLVIPHYAYPFTTDTHYE